MKLTITGEAKEIASLVSEIQGQKDTTRKTNNHNIDFLLKDTKYYKVPCGGNFAHILIDPSTYLKSRSGHINFNKLNHNM